MNGAEGTGDTCLLTPDSSSGSRRTAKPPREKGGFADGTEEHWEEMLRLGNNVLLVVIRGCMRTVAIGKG
jgi:hypothetical protein